MTTFTCTAITQTIVAGGKSEETYTYTAEGKSITFHAHPTSAWNWVLVSVNGMTRGEVNKLINAMVEAAMDKLPGQTMYEATASLTI